MVGKSSVSCKLMRTQKLEWTMGEIMQRYMCKNTIYAKLMGVDFFLY
jgi:hypothetical protein